MCWFFQHDSAATHSALSVQEVVAKNGTTVVLRPPYYTDLALCGFLLFLKLKMALKGRIFDDDITIQKQSQDAQVLRRGQHRIAGTCRYLRGKNKIRKFFDHTSYSNTKFHSEVEQGLLCSTSMCYLRCETGRNFHYLRASEISIHE
jgi:hypothetical protein